MRSTLSGYLLRKFKSSNGWQKLWVVFTGACLYFFKTFQDDFPLASLPLLGYAVHKPDPENDQINKDYVFKLVFKNHVYFFRAESQYTFERYDIFLQIYFSCIRINKNKKLFQTFDLIDWFFAFLGGSKFLVLQQNYQMNLQLLMEMAIYQYKEDIRKVGH